MTTSYRSAWAWADVLTEEQNKDIANPAALLRILPHAPGAHSTEFPSVTVQTVSRPASAGQHQEDTGSNQHEGVTRRGAAASHPHGENIFINSALYLTKARIQSDKLGRVKSLLRPYVSAR